MMDKEDKKEFIIEASRELFARFGLKKTTMDEIAKKCSMSKATLYYYFKSKEDIFRAVIDKEFNIFKEKMEVALSKASTPHDKLRAFTVTRVIHLKELANYYSTLADEYLEHYAFVEHERLKLTDWEIQTVQSVLDEGVQQGIFNLSDPKLTAVVLVFALKGLEYPWTVEQDIIEIERAIDLMLPILFKGIEKR
jgi:AcrR family transcriptional regulator